MPVLKDKTTRYEWTTDNPYVNNAPTWVEIEAQRFHSDSDRPQEANEEAALLDGRSAAAGKTLDFGYLIKKTTEEAAEISGLIAADDDETPVWIRETPEQDRPAKPQVFGGVTGCLASMRRMEQGFGGYKAWRLDLVAAGVSGLIEADPNSDIVQATYYVSNA